MEIFQLLPLKEALRGSFNVSHMVIIWFLSSTDRPIWKNPIPFQVIVQNANN